MLQAFVITLREGLEAFLIIGISLAYLRKSGRGELISAVHWGIGLSVLISIGAAYLFQQAANQALWEGVLALVAAVFYAVYLLTVKELRASLSTAAIMAWSSTVSALVLLPVAMVSSEQLVAATAYGWVVLLALALVSQVGGQGLIAYALETLPAAFTSVVLLLQPVMAAVLAWIVLTEPVSPGQAVGAAIELAGMILARRGSRT